MSEFKASVDSLEEDLKNIERETLEAPPERLCDPSAARAIHCKLSLDDEAGSFNRSIVQGLMDCVPPHDSKELENKGQQDRFNLTTGEGPAIKNEAVSGYMDIYTTPKALADIPLLDTLDPMLREGWGQIMAEEYSTMDRSDDASLPLHLQLCDTYVTHGVGVVFFEDKSTLKHSVSGLDHFKFPRKSGIVSSEIEICSASGSMNPVELYRKIDEEGEPLPGWDAEMIKLAIATNAKNSNSNEWSNWEEVQRDLKANEAYVDTICAPIEVIYTWVKEFSGKISFYISAKHALDVSNGGKERFLFRERDYYDSADQAFQIFPFSVGNGGRLYTVRGLGYLIYQICNAMDILHCKLLDNAKIGSSLIFQTSTVEDMQDVQLIDFGGGVAMPPGVKLVERPMGQNLNNSLVPALDASRGILDRSTGGMASGNMIMKPENDRRTKLEVSAQLDYLNKLNSFAINLFYGPYDKIVREKVRRAFTVRQKDSEVAARIRQMKQRCLDRGVPAQAFDSIDFKRVKATRIIGTGSRSSRIMLYEEMGKYYSTWDAVGRNNFDYDILVELIGAEKAERYAGLPNTKRQPYDHKIAVLENFQLLEGDYLDPQDGENHMVHLPVHIEELEGGLQGVEEGQIDLMDWTMEHIQLYRHAVATVEMTTVAESMEPELNAHRQRLQQIGEIANNGLKQLNKRAREEGQAQGDGQDPEAQAKAQEMSRKDQAHRQKMQQEMQMALMKLSLTEKMGQQKMVLAAQESMSKLARDEAETRARIQRLQASNG